MVREQVLAATLRLLRSLSLRLQRTPAPADEEAQDRRGYVLHRGHRLPPRRMRARMCGDAFRNEAFFYLSGVLEALKFRSRLRYAPGERIVDIGSGLGRLATGLHAEFGDVDYLGIDANAAFVRWCREHIEREHPSFRFVHLDMANALYNPAGRIGGRELRLPVEDCGADIVYLWGVFSNMAPEDVEAYVAEIARILQPGGRCFLTAFVEDGVPDVTINPADYVPYACDEPLTCVRYARTWFWDLLARHGLRVEAFRHHGTMFPKHSELYVAAAPR